MIRKIIHVDMDAFYASVEQRDRPELKGKPVIVGGDPRGRGVVASASYEARKFGIRSAMSSSKAHRLCPQGVFLFPDFSRYTEASRRIREIFLRVTPKVEPLSLDEAFLDVTENNMGEPLAVNLAKLIKQQIRDELGLTASAGVGPNKFIAKVASDYRKPDGLVVVPPERVLQFVENLPVERLWGVGPATARRLHEMGLRNAKDLRSCRLSELEAIVGSYASFLQGLAFGEDPREVDPEFEPKSSGSETTFEHDLTDLEKLEAVLRELADGVAADLKKIGRQGKTVTLKVRYSDFHTITRSQTLNWHFDDTETIVRLATRLMADHTEAGVRPVRLLGVTVSGFVSPDEPEQLWLNFPKPWI